MTEFRLLFHIYKWFYNYIHAIILIRVFTSMNLQRARDRLRLASNPMNSKSTNSTHKIAAKIGKNEPQTAIQQSKKNE
jgi:hypothetical protein